MLCTSVAKLSPQTFASYFLGDTYFMPFKFCRFILITQLLLLNLNRFPHHLTKFCQNQNLTIKLWLIIQLGIAIRQKFAYSSIIRVWTYKKWPRIKKSMLENQPGHIRRFVNYWCMNLWKRTRVFPLESESNTCILGKYLTIGHVWTIWIPD